MSKPNSTEGPSHLFSKFGEQRRAISPIIATVLIIAVTLIAAVAIGGFVFGIFGQSSQSAQVSVVAVTLPAADFKSTNSNVQFTCSTTAASPYLTMTNTGTAGATVTGVTITWAGANNAFTPTATCTIGAAGAAGATTSINFNAASQLTTDAVTGQSFQGTVTLSNGAQLLFTGTFQ